MEELMLRRLLAPLALALTLAACTTPVTPTALTVTELVPADEATNVSVDVVLSATFNLAIDADSLVGTFTLAAEGGADVAGVAALDADGTTATFTPAAPLAYATTYVATVSGDVETTTGVALGGEASWSFTTEDEPLPDALVGSDYADALLVEDTALDLAADVSGGEGAYAFALEVGSVLPAGVTLDATTGAIAGTPTETGLFAGTVVVTDEAAQTVELGYSIDVAAELVATGDYAAYAAPSNVNTVIDLTAPFAGGRGALTFTVIDGALPATFTSLDTLVPEYTGATYELDLDPVTGAIAGATGYFGLFEGMVQAEDELGQTATATFSLDLGLDLAYTGATTLIVPQGEAVVVNGDTVRISGVPTLALPADFPLLYFSLTFDGAASSGDVDALDFDINDGDGTISKLYVNDILPSEWHYAATVQEGFMDGPFLAPLPDSVPSAPVDFVFEYPGEPL
jgi:hypothetical protein